MPTIVRKPLWFSSYNPLLQNLNDGDSNLDTALESDLLMSGPERRCDHQHPTKSRVYALYAVICVLVASNIVFLGEVLRLRSMPRFPSSQLIFCMSSYSLYAGSLTCSIAPATGAIEYEVVKFHAGPLNNEEDDVYSSPPSPEVDQAWRDLYEGECSGPHNCHSFGHLSRFCTAIGRRWVETGQQN